MFRRKDVVITTLILCAHLSSVVKAYIETEVSKVPVTPGVELLVDRSSSSSPGMVFGMCTSAAKLHHEYNCSLYLETKKPIYSDDHLKVCNITLAPDRVIMFGVESVVTLGEDKAILQWYDRKGFAFAVLHFSGCKYYIVENDYVINNMDYIVPNDDTFSIVMHSDERQKDSCNKSEFCTLTLDDKGNIITGIIPWANHIFHGPITDVVNSPLKINLIVDSNDHGTEVGYIFEGKFIVLKEFIRNNMNEYDATATSKTHNLLTVCYPNSKKEVICAQFDLNGYLKFETQIAMTITPYTSLAVFNLPGGGFLIVDNHCLIHDVHDCDEGYESCFSVRRVHTREATVASRKFTCQLQYEYEMDLEKMHFHKNENGKYCFSYPITRYSYWDENRYSIDFDVVCFDQADLWK